MKFSIVTPSFKQLEWLRLCIASIRDQSGPDLQVEHIVQDGGSAKIEEFARDAGGAFFRDGVRVFDATIERPGNSLTFHAEKDDGMYDAINRGLGRADGDICAWLNCDEQYLPDALRHVALFFARSKQSEVIVGDTILLNESLEPRSFRPGVPPIRNYVQAFNLNLHSSSLFFRRSVFEQRGGFGQRFRSVGDAEWIAELLDGGVDIQRLDADVSAFVLGADNLSLNPVSVREKELWRAELPLSCVDLAVLRTRHLLRRVASGAYCPRFRGVSVFTPTNLHERTVFAPRWLDFRFRV